MNSPASDLSYVGALWAIELPEIQAVIASFLDRRTLVHLALVSKDWSPVATRELWRTVTNINVPFAFLTEQKNNNDEFHVSTLVRPVQLRGFDIR